MSSGAAFLRFPTTRPRRPPMRHYPAISSSIWSSVSDPYPWRTLGAPGAKTKILSTNKKGPGCKHRSRSHGEGVEKCFCLTSSLIGSAKWLHTPKSVKPQIVCETKKAFQRSSKRHPTVKYAHDPGQNLGYVAAPSARWPRLVQCRRYQFLQCNLRLLQFCEWQNPS